MDNKNILTTAVLSVAGAGSFFYGLSKLPNKKGVTFVVIGSLVAGFVAGSVYEQVKQQQKDTVLAISQKTLSQ